MIGRILKFRLEFFLSFFFFFACKPREDKVSKTLNKNIMGLNGDVISPVDFCMEMFDDEQFYNLTELPIFLLERQRRIPRL